MRGRKPKPTHLHALQGTRPSAPRHGEPSAGGNIGEPPSQLKPRAAELWRYYVDNAPPGLLAAADHGVFEAFITSLAMVRECSELLAREGLIVAGERGLSEHPASRALARYAALTVKAGSELGFSPASRPRIQIPEQDAPNPFHAFVARAVSAKPG